ncbi:unnamed protein product [Amoebophrya sp. A25]|nr:unnamed protein product [Amoebophrya sp. A25]|eukprot:GSA25T00011470001.1
MKSRFARRRQERARVLDGAATLAERIIASKSNVSFSIDDPGAPHAAKGDDRETPRKPGLVALRDDCGQKYEDGDEAPSKELFSTVRLDWSKVPPALDPFSELCVLSKPGRAERKRQQLESLLALHVIPAIERLLEKRGRHRAADGESGIADRPLRVVDFCAGSGHVGLLVAHLFGPEKVDITCVDRCPGKCGMGNQRVEEAGLKNARFVAASLEEYHDLYIYKDTDVLAEDAGRHGKGNSNRANASCTIATPNRNRSWDLAVSLHSCGLLTDSILNMSVRRGASFVLAPCCYGQIRGREREFYSNLFQLSQSVPRSSAVRSIVLRDCLEGLQQQGEVADDNCETKNREERKDHDVTSGKNRQKLLQKGRSRAERHQQKPKGDVVNDVATLEERIRLLQLQAALEFNPDICEPVVIEEEQSRSLPTGTRTDHHVAADDEDQDYKTVGNNKGIMEDKEVLARVELAFSDILSCADVDVVGNNDKKEADWSFEQKDHFWKVKRCMQASDIDRLSHVRERDPRYEVSLGSLFPLSCSPKNEVLIGLVLSSISASGGQQDEVRQVRRSDGDDISTAADGGVEDS